MDFTALFDVRWFNKIVGKRWFGDSEKNRFFLLLYLTALSPNPTYRSHVPFQLFHLIALIFILVGCTVAFRKVDENWSQSIESNEILSNWIFCAINIIIYHHQMQLQWHCSEYKKILWHERRSVCLIIITNICLGLVITSVSVRCVTKSWRIWTEKLSGSLLFFLYFFYWKKKNIIIIITNNSNLFGLEPRAHCFL